MANAAMFIQSVLRRARLYFCALMSLIQNLSSMSMGRILRSHVQLQLLSQLLNQTLKEPLNPALSQPLNQPLKDSLS